MKKHKLKFKRNGSFFDIWSIIHMTVGIILGWTVNTYIALALMILWEPFEILFLSPKLVKLNSNFGYETWRNSISDIIFDTLGILIGAMVLGSLLPPPFHIL